jgi:hypothetical protein
MENAPPLQKLTETFATHVTNYSTQPATHSNPKKKNQPKAQRKMQHSPSISVFSWDFLGIT